MRKQYKTPHISMVKVQMEADIAINSAKIYPGNDKGYVQDEWTEEADDTRNIDW